MSNHRSGQTFAVLLLLTSLLVSVAPIGAQSATPQKDVESEYRDPAGRFSMPIPPGWTVEETPAYVLLMAPEGDLSFAALVVEADDASSGVIAGWQILDPAFDPAAIEPDRAEIASDPGVNQTVVLTYELGGPTGRVAQGIGQRVGDQVYVFIVRGNFDTAVRRQSEIEIILLGSRVHTLTSTDLADRAPLPLVGERLGTFEAFIIDALAAFGVPGAAVAIVQGGQVVYAQGFGLADKGGSRPVTPDTLMMIGSVTKSFTTMLMASLVDDDLLAWDEPVVQILPSFAVADPTVSPQVTMRHLVCACSGVPRRDHELDFNADDLTAEDVIASVATFPLEGSLGETYQYSNQMVAVGGYVAGLAAGGSADDLGAAYAAALRERVLRPIGMNRATLDPGAVAADPDHALPHGATLEGVFETMPLATEAREALIAPSSGLWASANEMALYLLTALGRGLGPDGGRVVSAENLEATWQPQVDVAADLTYALGWYVEQWQGVRMVRHGGNTRGFTSEVAFLPDADLGVVVLTNAQRANELTGAIRQRLFEIVYDQPSRVEPALALALEEAKQERARVEAQLGDPIDPAMARALTGSYSNPALGTVIVDSR